MKKILIGVVSAIVFFVIMVAVFIIVFFFTGEDEMMAGGDLSEVSNKQLQMIIQDRDSLLVMRDSLLQVVGLRDAALDSVGRLLTLSGATVSTLEDRVQSQGAEIKTLREAEVNAQEMARTFATMTLDELTPIIDKLSDQVVLDIYKFTTNKRRKFLLSALGNDRAAQLTNRLVRKKGS